MAKTLEAHDKLIREIFEGSYQFEIPDYQRPYAWTTEQATELFDDLYSAMQDARVWGCGSQYFLGSIVLIKNDRDPKSSVVVYGAFYSCIKPALFVHTQPAPPLFRCA